MHMVSDPAPSASISVWEQPHWPFAIEFPSPLIEEIRRLVVEAFYSAPRGGVEVGGVLFGTKSRNGKRGCVRIGAWRPICCEHALGPTFVLSENDRIALTNLLAGSKREPALAGLEPVGWFHSHTRSDLTARGTDLEIYDRFFGHGEHIAFILRPAHMESTRATFLFRDSEGNVGSGACEEFAIDPTSLPAMAPVQPVASPSISTPAPAQTAKRRWGTRVWIAAALSAALAMGAGFTTRSYWLPAAAISVRASPVTDPAKDQIIEDLEKQATNMRAELLDQRMRTKRLERSLSTVKKQLSSKQRSLE